MHCARCQFADGKHASDCIMALDFGCNVMTKAHLSCAVHWAVNGEGSRVVAVEACKA